MATITGLTAERMEAIEAACIIDGDVIGDNLILTRHDATTINAGSVRGPQGIQGPVGQVSDAELAAAVATLNASIVAPHVRDINVRLKRVANQSIPSGNASTLILWDNEVADVSGFHAANSGNVNIPTGGAGIYLISTQITCGVIPHDPPNSIYGVSLTGSLHAYAGSGFGVGTGFEMSLHHGGNTFTWSNLNASNIAVLNFDDTIQVYVKNSNTSAINVTGQLIAARLSL